MSENFNINTGTKQEQYEAVLPQIAAMQEGEEDLIANLANVAAALKQQFNWWWVGFYLIKNNELVVGPFQGPVACSRIIKGRGVCGVSWESKKTIIVPDVALYPGHIACSSTSKSEIVVPILKDGTVVGVLDADSENLNYFDETDQYYLEKLVSIIPL